MTEFTYYWWRKEFGGLKSVQVKRLRELEKENERHRMAVSELTIEKVILRAAPSGNFLAPHSAVLATSMSGGGSGSRSGSPVVFSGRTDRPRLRCRKAGPMTANTPRALSPSRNHGGNPVTAPSSRSSSAPTTPLHGRSWAGRSRYGP